ncbi:Hypothetical predicted protein [Paramuricea clavata]|uniref:Uncharacterized protein n=1 Tax=Paramuricea clavata TaxID=317549 RepID=A0A6S7I9J5_PARCT|nr:Hypothetical predicted protein [Paramuricea clavata]
MSTQLSGDTSDSATDEQLKETIKAAFGTSMRQYNFAEVFTPPKNYVFSRVKLQYIHSQVADVLVDIFTRISDNADETIHLPRKKSQRKDCKNKCKLLESLDDNDESREENINSAGDDDDDDDDTIDDIEVMRETKYEVVVSHLNEQVIKRSPQLPSKTEIVQEAPV